MLVLHDLHDQVESIDPYKTWSVTIYTIMMRMMMMMMLHACNSLPVVGHPIPILIPIPMHMLMQQQ